MSQITGSPTGNRPRLSPRQLGSGWAPARGLACSLDIAPPFDPPVAGTQSACSVSTNITYLSNVTE